MKTLYQTTILAALLALVGVTPASANTLVFPHMLEVSGGVANFGGPSSIAAIPPDFFEPGSEPFEGQVAFVGAGLPGQVAFPGNTGLGGQPPTIPVELELFLVSAVPITVHNSSGIDSFFDVWVELHTNPVPDQQLGLSYNIPDAGGLVVDSFFDITYRIEFAPSGQLPGGGPEISGVLVGGLTANPAPGEVVPTAIPWFPSFPGGEPAPGLILGATETDLLPFYLKVGGDSIKADLVAVVPEPATLTLLALGGIAVLRKRRKQ